jgi:hypothetical protein
MEHAALETTKQTALRLNLAFFGRDLPVNV